MHKRKSFQTYEDRLNDIEQKINRMNINELRHYREHLKRELSNAQNECKYTDNNSRRSFYKGLINHVLKPSLNSVKTRIKLINRVLHNSVTNDFAKRFVEVAHNNLPIDTFQYIYGLSLSEIEIERQTINDVKEFMNECFIE